MQRLCSKVSYKIGCSIIRYIVFLIYSNALIGYSGRELVASKEILEEIFNEQEMVVMHRAHLEIEKAKQEHNARVASTSVSSGAQDNPGLIVLFM